MTLEAAHDVAAGPVRRLAGDPTPFDYSNPIVIDPANPPVSLDLYCTCAGTFTFEIVAGSSGSFQWPPIQFTTASDTPVPWPGDFDLPNVRVFTMYNHCKTTAKYWFKLLVKVNGEIKRVDPSIDNHPPSHVGGGA